MYSVPAVLSYNFSPRATLPILLCHGRRCARAPEGRAGPRTSAGPTPPHCPPGREPRPEDKMAELERRRGGAPRHHAREELCRVQHGVGQPSGPTHEVHQHGGTDYFSLRASQSPPPPPGIDGVDGHTVSTTHRRRRQLPRRNKQLHRRLVPLLRSIRPLYRHRRIGQLPLRRRRLSRHSRQLSRQLQAI